jgi:antitoxin VapB
MSEKSFSNTSPETTRFGRRLAAWEGMSITEAITEALRERLDRFEGRPSRAGTRAAVARIQNVVARLDHRSSEEILEYDEVGLPS